MTSTASARADTVVDPSSLLTDGAQLIGGQWVPAAGGETIDVINPATGEVLLRVPRSGPADIDAAVWAAFAAFPAWRDTSPVVRADLLRRWAALCRERISDIEILEQMEVGHPRWGPSPVPSVIEFPAGLADKITGQTLPTASPDVLGMTIREPFGVCGSIIPWNVPGPIMVTDVAPAIAVGNTIVVKPAEDAPLMAACARNLIPMHVELGGKAPQIVLPDADLSRAVPVIVGSITLNTGQVCAAGSRVLVPSSMRSSLVEALAARFASVRVGPWYEDVQMGPLISARQERRVLGYLDIGRAEGAEVVTGGHKLTGAPYDRGFFVEPTIFDRVTPEMRIAQEEIFGPVLSVLSYTSEDEAVQIANGTRYGLNACVWTSDVSKAVRLARRIQAGQVTVNGFGSRGVIGAPWGGYKHSGFGRTMSAESVLDYTQVKTVIINA
jgi:aldehyde dehydrogenase (NAD+)